MRELIFNPETYVETEEIVKGVKTGRTFWRCTSNTIGIFELVYTCINNVSIGELTKQDFRVIKRLKKTLKSVSQYKDEDKDAKICIKGCKLIVEEDEFAMIDKLFNHASKGFRPAIAEEVCTIFDMLESSTPYSPPIALEK